MKVIKRFINLGFALFFLLPPSISAQVLTPKDSARAGLTSKDASTLISGYGEAKVQYDLRYSTATADLTRNVLFVGHRFSNTIEMFSELEIENAKVAGGEPGGEVSMEQVYLKFDINKDAYIVAGLFTPRIGIINENHLPTTFNGNDRPFVEQFVIPATWRELGIGLYGAIPHIPGLNYSLAIVNGLNSGGFENGTGIEGGRFEGQNATASNIALTGSLLYYIGNFRIQASGYYGGSAGLTPKKADSLQLQSGAFGTPVALGEVDLQYFGKALSFRALGTIVNIPDAAAINRAYANNTPQEMVGAYAEVGYNILHLFNNSIKKSLTAFGRYEYMDLNYEIPGNGIINGINKKQYIITGLTYIPVHGIAIKADYVLRQTGAPNTALIVTPYPQAPLYYTSNGYINFGIGYSF